MNCKPTIIYYTLFIEVVSFYKLVNSPIEISRWGNAVMRGKAVFCHSRKTKNGKKFLLGQQLHVTILQNGTKYG